MTPTTPVGAQDPVRAAFDEMYPDLVRLGRWAFRTYRDAEDRLQDAGGLFWLYLQRLGRQQKLHLAPNALRIALLHARLGRGPHRASMQPRSAPTAAVGHTIESVLERAAPVEERAAVRLALAAWLAAMTNRERAVFLALASGDTTGRAATRLGITPGRVSQVKARLAADWRHRSAC